ncbi:MAG: GNAT family protein [Pseudomonadota bacterium]
MSEQRVLDQVAARVYFRHARSGDRSEFTNLMASSRSLHHPWITPPTNAAAFNQYLARIAREDHEGFLICRYADDSIVGAINLNNIVRGTFLSATLGYYVGAPFVGSGYMSEGLELVKAYAFDTLRLHRLEANIQPDNTRSLNLVRRCGFEFEGLARQFLYIAGAWRDHERWTCVDERDTLYRQDTFR